MGSLLFCMDPQTNASLLRCELCRLFLFFFNFYNDLVFNCMLYSVLQFVTD